jgi:hypothetical protein
MRRIEILDRPADLGVTRSSFAGVRHPVRDLRFCARCDNSLGDRSSFGFVGVEQACARVSATDEGELPT